MTARKTVTVEVDNVLHEVLLQRAEAEDRPISQLMRRAAVFYLARTEVRDGMTVEREKTV